MKTRSLSAQHQKLRWLISEANNFEADQTELRAHWARYLCILASGFLENALKEVYSRYARSCTNTQVADYVESTLSKIQNPKASKFVEVARSFNKKWADDLAEYLDTDGQKDAIDAIMANRHRIAHGKDSGITLARIKEYLAKSIQVIEFIEAQCNL